MEYVINIPRRLGESVLSSIQRLGNFFLFFLTGLVIFFKWPVQFSKLINQIYFIGLKSVLIVCLTGLFTGMVLGLQGYYTLVQFGSEGFLGTAVALTIVRELGPVLTAIMIVARAGSAMTAEIGIMRNSEQIDALTTMNINPVRFIFSPRIWAGIISFPLLTAIFDFIGIIGGYITGTILLGLNAGIYFARVESSITLSDVTGGFIKSFVFALIVITICCYKGYYTHMQKNAAGSKGVGYSTTSAVVSSCVWILIWDYIITSFLL
ncbi:MAG: MlaE family ABC transporter permease [Thermodesulfobacteriota bacterium]